jgi:hypothetical protein
MVPVTPRKKLAAFRLDPELIEGLQVVKDRTGAPIAEQVRRAIVAWLRSNGVTMKTERPRASKRKRP